MKHLLIYMVLSIYLSGLYAQQPVFKHFTVDDGLPSSEVYNVIQDSKGYMWFSSDKGVSCFDGYHFKTFSAQDGLSDNTVFEIAKDSKGQLWFCSFSGKIFYFKNSRFFTVPLADSIIDKIKYGVVNDIYVDSKDTVWVGVNNLGICKIDPHYRASIIRYDVPKRNEYCLKKMDGNQGILAFKILSDKGSRKLLVNDKKYTSPIKLMRTPASQKIIYLQLHDHSILLAYDKWIALVNESGIVASTYLTKRILSICEDVNNNLWIGFYTGGVKTYNNPEEIFQISSDTYLDSLSVSKIKTDNENSMWFTTLESGVYYLPSFAFQSYTIVDGLGSNKVMGITGYQNKIFAQLNDGSIYRIYNKRIQKIFTSSPKRKSSSACMLMHSDQTIWLGGSIYSGTIIINQEGKVIKKFPTMTSLSFYEDANHLTWIGTHNGIKTQKGSVIEGIKKTSSLRVETVCEQNKKLWIGSLDGLWSFYKDSLIYEGGHNPLFKNRIADIKKSEDDILWMASKGAGLLIQDKNKVYQIEEKDGLASNICNAVFIDEQKNIWVATNKGISWIRVKNLEKKQFLISNYNNKNGLLSNEVNKIYVWGGKVWIASNHGIILFDTNKKKSNVYTPPVYFSKIKINQEDTVNNDDYILTYRQNNIAFEFVGLSYKNEGSLNYKYRLEGLDSNWIYTNRTNVQYTTLTPGRYSFKVMAQNSDGYWSALPAVVNFTIARPFWTSWWFVIIVLLSFIGIVIVGFKWRVNKIRKKEHERMMMNKQVVALELKALKAQMNPHFTFNSINALQYYFDHHQPEKAHNYLSKFALLIRNTLDNSERSFIPIHEELEVLKLYMELESMRFKKQLNYRIIIDENIDSDYEQIPPMLIQPYIENAIWHGLLPKNEEGNLTIKLEKEEEYIRCSIEDDGIGRERAEELKKQKKQLHKSFGMMLTKERLDLLNSTVDGRLNVTVVDLKDEKSNPTGTRVEILIPFQ